jgi:hypothetical protein
MLGPVARTHHNQQMGAEVSPDVQAVERWFIQRGLPHLIEGYSASTDILTRAAPLLTLVFLFEALGALNFDRWWQNMSAVAAAFAFVVAGWAFVNRWRGRQPLEPPRSVGAIEISAFLLIPALVPLIFGGNLAASAGILALNVALLGLIYAGTSYALVPIATWATKRLFRQLGDTVRLFARALPLLLVFVTFLFINAEVWQMASRLFGPLFAATLGLFATFGALFSIVRLPAEVDGLARFESWLEVTQLCSDGPGARFQPAADIPPVKPLHRRQWLNVGLVVLFGQAVQVLLVVVLLGGFLVLLGVLAFREETMLVWTGLESVNVLIELTLFDRTVLLTEELLRVAGFLAAFSGLYFAVTAVTDTAYRQEFFDEVVGEVREALAVRALYLDALDG